MISSANGVSSFGITSDSVTTLTNKTIAAADNTLTGVINNTLTTTTGDIIYASGANTPARLAIGSTDQVLKVSGGVPVWGAPATTNTEYTLINTGGTALTGAASITISGISGKNKLFVTIDGCSSASGNSNFFIRLNADSGNNYAYFNGVFIGPDAATEDSADPANKMFIGAISSNAASVLSGDCWLDGCNSSGIKVMHHSTASNNAGGTNGQLNTGGGTYSGSSTISSISIHSDTGNFDAGTIFVYGA